MLSAVGRDRHPSDLVRARVYLIGGMLKHVPAGDLHLVTQTERAEARDLDPQRLLVDDVGTVRPHNHRTAGA